MKFSQTAYDQGYEDGFENRDPSMSLTDRRFDSYMDGYEIGQRERREVDKSGSSNT